MPENREPEPVMESRQHHPGRPGAQPVMQSHEVGEAPEADPVMESHEEEGEPKSAPVMELRRSDEGVAPPGGDGLTGASPRRPGQAGHGEP